MQKEKRNEAERMLKWFFSDVLHCINKFSNSLEEMGIRQMTWKECFETYEFKKFAKRRPFIAKYFEKLQKLTEKEIEKE